jgi:hypothetical protein
MSSVYPLSSFLSISSSRRDMKMEKIGSEEEKESLAFIEEFWNDIIENRIVKK